MNYTTIYRDQTATVTLTRSDIERLQAACYGDSERLMREAARTQQRSRHADDWAANEAAKLRKLSHESMRVHSELLDVLDALTVPRIELEEARREAAE